MPQRWRVCSQTHHDAIFPVSVAHVGVEPASLCLTVRQRVTPPDSPEILQKIAENVPLEPLVWKRELNGSQQVARWTQEKSLATREKPFDVNVMHNSVSFG